MRFIFLFAFIFVCGVTNFAQAQDEAQISSSFNPLVLDEDNLLDKELGVSAEITGSKSEILEGLYNKCVRRGSATLEMRSLVPLCACATAKADETFSEEDAQLLLVNSLQGQLQRERYFALAFLPCMEYPVYDLVQNTCVESVQLDKDLKKPISACKCLSKKMTEFAEARMSQKLRAGQKDPAANGSVDSVLASILEDKNFKILLNSERSRCITNYRAGWAD